MAGPAYNLDGERVITADVFVPYSGIWVADVTLALSSPLAHDVVLQLEGLSLIGHVARAASFAGARSARIQGGRGGWGKSVPARSYRSSSGVSLSHVLQDAAIEVGEAVELAVDRTIGTAFVREAGPASNVLRQLVGDGWWMAPDGVTHVGPRATGPITSPFTVISWSGGKGRFDIATETLEDWVPGRTFVSPTVTTPQTIRSVCHRVDNEGVGRVEVMTSDNRFGDLVRASLPFLRYLGRHLYLVQGVSGTSSVDARPVDPLAGLPDIVGAPLLPGLLGEQVTPEVGSRCLVEFISADPTRPIVTGGDPDHPPTLAKLAGGGKGVARQDDEVTITSAQLAAAVMVAGTTPVTITNPLRCSITSSSTKVQSG